MALEKEWFSTWFCSPYYPLLYNNRDESEAGAFLECLMQALHLPANAPILDLACGRGRHARFLSALGYNVTGLDISEQSIADAQLADPSNQVDFRVHDMRLPFGDNLYLAVLNLFTSFGYFNDVADNLRVLKNIENALMPDGVFVIDYLNKPLVLKDLIPYQEMVKDNVQFRIRKTVENNVVVKTIEVEDGATPRVFQERVQLFGLDEMRSMIAHSGLAVQHIYGDYTLQPWTVDSPRLIITGGKA
jgi:SAM-dependent methyltransferase